MEGPVVVQAKTGEKLTALLNSNPLAKTRFLGVRTKKCRGRLCFLVTCLTHLFPKFARPNRRFDSKVHRPWIKTVGLLLSPLGIKGEAPLSFSKGRRTTRGSTDYSACSVSCIIVWLRHRERIRERTRQICTADRGQFATRTRGEDRTRYRLASVCQG